MVRVEGKMDGTKYRDILVSSSQSPDLNSIENLWSHLKIAVHMCKPSNLKELEQFSYEEWAKIPVERCAKLIEIYKVDLQSTDFEGVNSNAPANFQLFIF